VGAEGEERSVHENAFRRVHGFPPEEGGT